MLRRTLQAGLLGVLVASAANAQITEIRDVVYAQVASHALHVDLYLPTSTTPRPCVVWLHVGGWRSGHRSEAQDDARDLAAVGLAVAAVEYRLSGVAKWPAQIHDCKGAVRWLRANAATYNLDPDRIGAFGFSAGGHLAAMLGTTGGVASMEGTVGGNLGQSSRVQFVADFAGPTDLFGPAVYEPADSFPSELIGKGIGEIKQNMTKPEYKVWVDLVHSANPARYVSGDDAPFYIAQGSTDTVVPSSQSQLLHNALQTGGISSTLLMVASGHTLPAFAWKQRENELVRMLLQDVAFRVYGKGCTAAGADEPGVGGATPPVRGSAFDLTLSAGPPSMPTAAMFCTHRTLVTLEALGAPGCAFLVINPVLLHFAVTDSKGGALAHLPLPAQLPPGIVMWVQWAVMYPQANTLGWVMSNAARVAIQ